MDCGYCGNKEVFLYAKTALLQKKVYECNKCHKLIEEGQDMF